MNLWLSISKGPVANTALTDWSGDPDALVTLLSHPVVGTKDGGYLVRGPTNGTATRADEHIVKAYVVILDGDKRIDPESGELFEGAPSPEIVHEALIDAGIGHILYTSYSHLVKPGFWRWRCIVFVELANAEELRAVVDHLIGLLQARGVMLAPAVENYRWSQAWFLPRLRSADAPFVLLRCDDGDPLDVPAIVGAYRAARPHIAAEPRSHRPSGNSPIDRFNVAQGDPAKIIERLESHGYILKGTTTVNGDAAYRLIRPGSTSGMPGVTVFRGQAGKWLTCSHHGEADPLAGIGPNGRAIAHDAFDVYRILEHCGDERAALAAIRPTEEEPPDWRFDAPPEGERAEPGGNEREPDKPPAPRPDRYPADITTPVEFTPSTTEDGLALVFSKTHRDSLIYVPAMGKWFLWNGYKWAMDEKLGVFTRVRSLIRLHASHVPSKKTAAGLRKKTTVAGVEFLARCDERTVVAQSELDTDIWVLNTPEGIVDLRTGAIKPPDPKRRLTKSTACAPANAMWCPTWLRFLHDVTRDDDDLVKFLQRVAGYTLTGETREHALFFVYGLGGNGKGIFLNTLTGILGDYATVAAMQTFTDARTEQHPTDLALLRGARLVTAQETRQGQAWAESKIKAMTGGDPITARFMRQDFFTYQPQFKLLLSGNHKPLLKTVDESVRRRFHVIPFTVTFTEDRKDRQLFQKLQAEWPGILRWMLDGCLAWQQQGLNAPAIVRDTTDEYLLSQDFFAEWCTERCVTGPKLWDKFDWLYEDWKAYCKTSDEAPGKKQDFTDALERHGFYKRRTRAEGSHVAGLRRKHDTQDRQDQHWGGWR